MFITVQNSDKDKNRKFERNLKNFLIFPSTLQQVLEEDEETGKNEEIKKIHNSPKFMKIFGSVLAYFRVG